MVEDVITRTRTLVVADGEWDADKLKSLHGLLDEGCPGDAIVQHLGGEVRSLMFYAARACCGEAIGKRPPGSYTLTHAQTQSTRVLHNQQEDQDPALPANRCSVLQ